MSGLTHTHTHTHTHNTTPTQLIPQTLACTPSLTDKTGQFDIIVLFIQVLDIASGNQKVLYTVLIFNFNSVPMCCVYSV